MKTKSQLETELRLSEVIEKERQLNKSLYAIKLVERLVFGFVGLALTALALALIYTVVNK